MQIKFKILNTEGAFDVINSHLHLYLQDERWEECLEQIKKVEKMAIEEPPPVDNRIEADNIQKKMMEEVYNELGDINGFLFLEIGASTGWASIDFVKRGAFGVAIDINEKLLPKNIEGLITVVADGRYLPLADSQFDFVFMSSTLHHFWDEDKVVVLKEVKRVLKPEGKFLGIGDPPRKEKDYEDGKVRDEYYQKKWGLIETQPTQEKYQSFFEQAGFTVRFIFVDNNTVMVGYRL